MTIKQLSIFLENKPGKLAELIDLLASKGVDLRALTLAEAPDFGVVRLLVNDPYETSVVLKENGIIFSITQVLAVEMPDEPGSLAKILSVLGKADVNIDYTYVFLSKNKSTAYMILRVKDNDLAIKVLSAAGITLVGESEIFA